MKECIRQILPLIGSVALIAACAHEIRIRAPEDPIVINLNIKIEQEIHIKVEKDIDDLLLNNKDLF